MVFEAGNFDSQGYSELTEEFDEAIANFVNISSDTVVVKTNKKNKGEFDFEAD